MRALLVPDYEAENDESLAVSAIEDRRAFLILYDRYAERLERYVRTRVHSKEEVEDLVSTVMMRALAKVGTYERDRGSFRAWLFGIARNEVSSYLRGCKPPTMNADLLEIMDANPTVEEVAIQRERGRAVRALLDELTMDQREALALRYLAELTFAEVGQELGKTEAAAKMLVRRGLALLRRRLPTEEVK